MLIDRLLHSIIDHLEGDQSQTGMDSVSNWDFIHVFKDLVLIFRCWIAFSLLRLLSHDWSIQQSLTKHWITEFCWLTKDLNPCCQDIDFPGTLNAAYAFCMFPLKKWSFSHCWIFKDILSLSSEGHIDSTLTDLWWNRGVN